MILIDGKATAEVIRKEISAKANVLSEKAGRKPGLSVILVGQNSASTVYVRNKEKACIQAGFTSFTHELPENTTKSELFALIDKLNNDKFVDGILLQLPLPDGLDSQLYLERILPEKDVDGFHPVNMGKLTLGLPGFKPCTPAGVISLLKRYNLSPAGKKAVVIGRSNIVGKPLALMLASPGEYGNATVTICHSATKDMASFCREADFLFLAIGKPNFIKADMVKPGAVIIDIGINRTESGITGDCDFLNVSKVASAITPVPGGVGPMTIAQLLQNTLQSFKEREGFL